MLNSYCFMGNTEIKGYHTYGIELPVELEFDVVKAGNNLFDKNAIFWENRLFFFGDRTIAPRTIAFEDSCPPDNYPRGQLPPIKIISKNSCFSEKILHPPRA